MVHTALFGSAPESLCLRHSRSPSFIDLASLYPDIFAYSPQEVLAGDKGKKEHTGRQVVGNQAKRAAWSPSLTLY